MDGSPLREIKPVVVPAQYFAQAPFLAGCASVFLGSSAFVVSNVVLGLAGGPVGRSDEGPVVVYGVVVFILSFVACMGVLWVKAFKEPVRTTYTIFPDRVEYEEGLWNRRRRTVVFDQVIDVVLEESVLQQTRNAGTVTLVTQQLVSGQDGKLSNRRIALRNLPNPREVYELIRSLALKK